MTERLKPYLYNGWMVHHYTEGKEQFIACKEAAVLRATTKQEIERLIDHPDTCLDCGGIAAAKGGYYHKGQCYHWDCDEDDDAVHGCQIPTKDLTFSA